MRIFPGLLRLERFDENEFSAWLLSGFTDFFLKDHPNHPLAFYPLHHRIGHEQNVTQELKRIYDDLSGAAQKRFRSGVAAAIANMPTHDSSVPILRELLHLAGQIKAVEILPILIPQIGNGYFGALADGSSQGVFSLTLDIVSGMAPGMAVSRCLRRLIGSSFFRAHHAPKAFIALCRAEPHNFYKHLHLLRGFFAELHRRSGVVNISMTAARFVNYVPVPDIAENLSRLIVSCDPASPSDLDNWLLDGLFLRQDAPLELGKAEGHFTVTEAGSLHPATRLTLDETRPACHELIVFLNRVVGCQCAFPRKIDEELTKVLPEPVPSMYTWHSITHPSCSVGLGRPRSAVKGKAGRGKRIRRSARSLGKPRTGRA